MKKTRMKTTRNMLVAGMMAVLCCSLGKAQIIYSNNFTIGSPASINGAAPTYVNPNAAMFGGDTGAAWDVVTNNFTAGYYANQNGTLGAGQNSVLLPFTPQNGYVYTMSYSLTFAVIPPGGGWGAIGYGAHLPPSNTSTTGYRFNDPAVNGNPWALLNYAAQGGGAGLFSTRSHEVGHTANLMTAVNTPYTINFVLDTSGAQWSTALYIDSTLVTNYTYAVNANPTISSVGYGQTTTTAGAYKWNTFTLSAVAVPEPSTPALISLGAAMLLLVTLYRRRRQEIIR